MLTQDYEALGEHYTTAIMPAGVRKPKQKASVEGMVGKIATAIIAKLRNEVFYSFPDLKAAVFQSLSSKRVASNGASNGFSSSRNKSNRLPSVCSHQKIHF